MRILFALTFISLFLTASAQERIFTNNEIGITVGPSLFFGDLGIHRRMDDRFLDNFHPEDIRGMVGVLFRNNLGSMLSLRFSLIYAQVAGDDANERVESPADEYFLRRYRNLRFKSHILELAAIAEINILTFEPGDLVDRWTPFVSAGLGVFQFSPMGQYQGTWEALQPIGTEGQGLPNYSGKEKYKLIQLAVPVGIGVKYNMTRRTVLTIEAVHRHTTTDYLDDVSSNYVDPDYVYLTHGSTPKAEKIIALADPSSRLYPDVTRPGAQRGNPSSLDSYAFLQVSFTYIINLKKDIYDCPRRFIIRNVFKRSYP